MPDEDQFPRSSYTMEYQQLGDSRWLLGPGGPGQESAVEQARAAWRRRGVTGVRVIERTTKIINQRPK